MVKEDEFDNAIESLRGKIAAIRTSLSDIKNDVIQALREENISLKNEAQYESSNIIRNKMDQYNRRNNVVVDGTPTSVKTRELEDKCIEVFGKIDIKIHETDIEPKQLSVSSTESFARKYWQKILSYVT